MRQRRSGGLAPDPVEVDGLTEIRVHGVGGTGPEDMLGDPRPVRVSGDRIAGFYRTADAAGRHREAYSWGGLTSHSPLRVFWLLLTPSMLANMAGWTARRRIMNGKLEAEEAPTTSTFRWFARIAALALTLSTALMVTILSLDTLAYQCFGQRACRVRLWGTSLLDFVAPFNRPGLRLAVGVFLPLAVAAGFYFLASRSRASYEGIEPPIQAEPGTDSVPDSSRLCAAAQKGGLRHADFWSGKRWHEHLSLLHLTVGVSVAAGILGWCMTSLAGTMGYPVDGFVWGAQAASAAAVLLIILVILLLAWDEAQERLALGIFMLSVGVLLVAFFSALMWPVTLGQGPPGAHGVSQPLGTLPGVMLAAELGWIITLLLLLPLICQQIWAWGSRWKHAMQQELPGPGRIRRLRHSVRGSIPVFPWAAPVVLHIVALILGNAVLLSVMVLAAKALGRVEYEPPLTGTPGQGAVASERFGEASVLWVPKVVVLVAGILAWSFIALLFAFAVVLTVWFCVSSKKDAPMVRRELAAAYAASQSLGQGWSLTAPPPDKRDAWIYSAFEEYPAHQTYGPQAFASPECRPSRWVRKVALMRQIGQHAHQVVAWFAIVIAAGGVIAAVAFAFTRGWVLQEMPMAWVETGAAVGAWLPAVYVLAARVAFRNERVRKILMSPFDVGTFFPRSFHPFAPPSYAERAVPELTRRIWWLHDNNGRVVLTAHSQGSVVAAAVILRQAARREEKDKRIGLVTFGCPLGKLYRWSFPALFSDGLMQSLARGAVGIGDIRWRNVHYSTDYIGGPVRAGDWAADIPKDIEVDLVDPPTDRYVFGQRPPSILSHTGYWMDTRFWQRVDSMCEDIQRPASSADAATHPKDPATGDALLVPAEGIDAIPADPATPGPYRGA